MLNFDLTKIEFIVDRYRGQSESLIPAMQEIQAEYHYLPEEVLILVSERLAVPLSQAYGVATFYNAFSLIPRGKHLVSICHGTACHVRGGRRISHQIGKKLKIKPSATTQDLQFTMEIVRCLGCCSIGPVMRIDDDTYGHLTPEDVGSILEKYKKEEEK